MFVELKLSTTAYTLSVRQECCCILRNRLHLIQAHSSNSLCIFSTQATGPKHTAEIKMPLSFYCV